MARQRKSRPTAEELVEVIDEATEVHEMTKTRGWKVLQRDIKHGMREINRIWSHYPPQSNEFVEMRLQSLKLQGILTMVEDYETNRKKAEELYIKLKMTDENIPYDMDLETPLSEGKED